MRLCRACGFGYPEPHVSGDEDFYSLLHEDPSYPMHRWEFSIVRDELRRRVAPSTILDYGAGDGAFLAQLSTRWVKYAMEASPTMRHTLAGRGIEVIEPANSDGTAKGPSLGVITMFQVLEHVADFSAALRRCWQLLRPGGRLYVSVPNGETLREWESATRLPDMPPFHVNQWTPVSLALSLQEVGFDDIRWRCDPWSVVNLAALITAVLRAEAARETTLAARLWVVDSRGLRRALFAAAVPLYIPRLVGALLGVPALGAGVNLLVAARKPVD